MRLADRCYICGSKDCDGTCPDPVVAVPEAGEAATCDHQYPPPNSDGTCPSCGKPRAGVPEAGERVCPECGADDAHCIHRTAPAVPVGVQPQSMPQRKHSPARPLPATLAEAIAEGSGVQPEPAEEAAPEAGERADHEWQASGTPGYCAVEVAPGRRCLLPERAHPAPAEDDPPLRDTCTCVGNGFMALDCPLHMPKGLRKEED